MCRPCADRLLPREERHALRSDGGKVESQKALSRCLICIFNAVVYVLSVGKFTNKVEQTCSIQ
jgi:hypothetical protein